MLCLLLLLQAAPAPVAGNPADALARLLADANRATQAAALAPGGWWATVETEVSTLGRREGRIEGATLLEQTSSVARWSSDGGYQQRVVGSRSFPNAIPLSRLAFLQIGWVVPSLLGERILVISRTGPRNLGFSETMRGPLAPIVVVHPLASDRDRYYTYSSGAGPAPMAVGARTLQVIHVEVHPRVEQPEEETLFEGDLFLDAATRLPVRLFGRFRTVGPRPDGGFLGLNNLPEMFEPTVTLVDLINQPLDGGGWSPWSQRFEIETASSLASGYGAARRVITRFHDVNAIEPGSTSEVAIGASTFGYILSAAPRDSLRDFGGWYSRVGEATRAASSTDFHHFRPDRLQPAGRPILLLEGTHSGDFLRINRIEGPFTGVALAWRLRDAAPGVVVRGRAGYAWSEQTIRGGASVAWANRKWVLEAGGARSLDPTNKFRNQFDNPALAALLSRDKWDYVDREALGVAVTRTLTHQRGGILRAEAGWAQDGQVERHMAQTILGGQLRPNRRVAEGDYLRTRLLLDWNPDVSPLFARDGFGFRGEVERGDGDLDYTRVETRFVARRSLGGLFLVTRLHLGATFSDRPPPQQLFELGGSAGLPGYEDKEFAGDRAALFRVRVTRPLGILDVPFRVGSWLTLPSLAPAISVGFQGGFTDASGQAARDAVRALGNRYDLDSDAPILTGTGEPVPLSIPTDDIRPSVDIRVGIFGDALGFGFARALQAGRKTKFFVAIGRQF